MEAKLSCRGITLIAGKYQTWSSESRSSPCSKYWLWTKRMCYSYIVCQLSRLRNSSMETMLHLLCRHFSLPPVQTTVAPYLLSRLLLLTSYADCSSLPLEETAAPYLLSRHYSLVIASGLEVTFIIPTIPSAQFQHE
ncbi:hypothetical protein Tco_1183881 [Tanacetum coccineum]